MARYELRKMPDYKPDRNRHHKGPWGVWDSLMKQWVLNASYTSKNKAGRILIALKLHEEK